MSFEQSERIYTAQDLLEFLQPIQPALRPRMGITMVITDTKDKESWCDASNFLYVNAYHVIETEGCQETGLSFSCDKNDKEER